MWKHVLDTLLKENLFPVGILYCILRRCQTTYLKENKKEYLRGEKNAYLPEHQRADKSNVHRVNVSLLGGANYIDGKVNPVFTGRLGYETCYFLFELEGSYSRAKYPTLNSYYNTFVAARKSGLEVLARQGLSFLHCRTRYCRLCHAEV